MKRIIIFLFLIVWIGLSACSNTDNAAQTDEATTPSQAQEPVSETTAELVEPYIVSIIDRSEAEHLDVATAEEVFYEDEINRYIFPNIISHHVIVTYSDGISEPIIEALEAGRASISDLNRFQIDYAVESKNGPKILVAITDDSANYPLNEAVEYFYEDSIYRYSFNAGKSSHIIAHYSDGFSESITNALQERRITIEDLDHFGIEYFKKPQPFLITELNGKANWQLTEAKSEELQIILQNLEWQEGSTRCAVDYSLLAEGVEYLYHSTCGTVIDLENQKFCTLSDDNQQFMLDLLPNEEMQPGEQSFESLIGCTLAWTSLDDDIGLSSFSDIANELPWLYSSYIEQHKKEVRAIQFTSNDILILMSTYPIENMEAYIKYIDIQLEQTLTPDSEAIYTDITSDFTIIIISEDHCTEILNALNNAFVGYWPE